VDSPRGVRGLVRYRARMLDDELPQRIHEQTWIAKLLAWFDFDVARVVNGPVEQVHLVRGEPLEMIAGTRRVVPSCVWGPKTPHTGPSSTSDPEARAV
jgi:hypothetical protein